MIILLIFSINFDLKMFIYFIFLSFFLSVNLQKESYLHTVKNQALIANYSISLCPRGHVIERAGASTCLNQFMHMKICMFK